MHAAPEPSQQDRSGGAPLRILAVDDDALVLFGTAALLEDLGHVVSEATSGAEAVDMFDGGENFDLVITDQAMPNMTGVELAQTLRQRAPDLPIILASGYAEMPDGAGDAIAHRLEKPFDDTLLRDAIRIALRKRDT